jgi:hypothetical protein
MPRLPSIRRRGDEPRAAAPPPLAWPLQRCEASGWRLRVAWAYNGTLLGGGLVWLAIMLRALDIDQPGGGNLGAFWQTFILGLVQAFFIQDPIKVLLISFVSPAFWPCLSKQKKAGTESRHAGRLRMFLRGIVNSLIMGM